MLVVDELSWIYVKTYCLVTFDNKYRHRKSLFGVGENNSLGIMKLMLKFADEYVFHDF